MSDFLTVLVLLVVVAIACWQYSEPTLGGLTTDDKERPARRIEHYASLDHERKRLELRALRMFNGLPPGGWHS